jgi:hypothetical protein
MIGSAVNENNLMVGTEFAPEISRRHHPATTTAQDHDPLSSVHGWHLNLRYPYAESFLSPNR